MYFHTDNFFKLFLPRVHLFWNTNMHQVKMYVLLNQ